MKTNVWLTLTAMLATSALAQQVTNPPATTPAPAPAPAVMTPAPATAPPATVIPKQKAAKPAPAAPLPALEEKPVSLSPGPAKITGNNVNLRGKATIFSEVVKHLNSGDSVTVIEQVIREKPKAGEPTQWAKIGIPPDVRVWVHASYIDATNKVVLPKRLNVRTGPGENYSVVGVLEQGAPVKELSTKGNWIEIESPADAYAFVAAIYLKQEGAAAAVPPVVSIAPPVTEPAPTPAVVPEPAPVVATTTEAPTPTPVPTATPAPPAVAPAPEPEPAPPPAEEPPPLRIVQHEGVVKGTWSIQAPTRFALVDPNSGKTVNYLYTSSTNLDLRRYKGLRIIVTGEEGLDERWKNTPVITIQRIQVVQ
ncbi:MAG: SH3 domain-containing protein [Verrucomicrobia bacterium]|jgi:uncharacterized protein YgiM (DUF1202 family)|nr:SH3 domain-containing protein [Verrucomicrobiota bacterium]